MFLASDIGKNTKYSSTIYLQSGAFLIHCVCYRYTTYWERLGRAMNEDCSPCRRPQATLGEDNPRHRRLIVAWVSYTTNILVHSLIQNSQVISLWGYIKGWDRVFEKKNIHTVFVPKNEEKQLFNFYSPLLRMKNIFEIVFKFMAVIGRQANRE